MISEKISKESLKEKILKYIPGYGHYKLEENLREWNRSIRDESDLFLSNCEKILMNILDFAVSKRDRNSINQIENIRKKIHMLKETINTQTYGYFPSFSVIKIDQEVLKSIINTDEKILENCKNLKNKLSNIEKKYNSGFEKEAILDLTDILQELNPIDSLIAERYEMARTGLVDGSQKG